MIRTTAVPDGLPPVIIQTAAALLALLDQQLPGWVAGLWLTGSAALDDFWPAISNLDFVASISWPLTHAEGARVAGIHGITARK
ncbi:hypothetical protein [Methylobacterium aquaticum]|jgi:hypothetical protein|uniref:Uncharacterized protein n=1 Tax=Methylobacterium aquaticum TaxID=270351 RepID=A0A0J6VI96_9HYPH|nr:hypothetical protein [Methylobacterium aquaticum]KMO38821.1 hypothetical protein VP06_05630 [Methylobacterium aquaticum]